VFVGAVKPKATRKQEVPQPDAVEEGSQNKEAGSDAADSKKLEDVNNTPRLPGEKQPEQQSPQHEGKQSPKEQSGARPTDVEITKPKLLGTSVTITGNSATLLDSEEGGKSTAKPRRMIDNSAILLQLVGAFAIVVTTIVSLFFFSSF